MNFNNKGNPNLFPDYLDSLIKLSELQKMTDHLDNELADSQKIMMNIQSMFDSIPKTQNAGVTTNNPVKNEDVTQFLSASPPQLLMEDMSASMVDIDLDVIIATMKAYTEDLRKNVLMTQPQLTEPQKSVTCLDLESYASSLDQCVKRLAKIKLNKQDETNRNVELEAKLEELCKDVNMFTQMVEAKKALSETNTEWSPIQQNDNALFYDNVINKLLAGINEVTYMLKNKN